MSAEPTRIEVHVCNWCGDEKPEPSMEQFDNGRYLDWYCWPYCIADVREDQP